MRSIKYTRHALTKFDVLKRYGFEITLGQVEGTVSSPDVVLEEGGGVGRLIAQKRLTQRHVLRVVYRHEGDALVVITFYPGRRDRCEG